MVAVRLKQKASIHLTRNSVAPHGWPPPDVVRTNIQRTTDGRLSTPVELYTKIKDSLENGQFKTVITDDEACLIAHAFYSRDDYSLSRAIIAIYAIPGFGYALSLVSRRLGLDITVFKACGERSLEVEYSSFISPEPPATTSEAPQEQYRLGNLSEDEKGVCRAQAEVIRREAWAVYETRLACKDAELP
ncbi:uncharacterized protein B0T15DRAFT_495447 [Chaetomium strumarium]|uniref:Uncharacterized protein n=1 Tax=Chaetomium strumarium TaxID=1170767 RepID=A0AAJ0GMT1_9PEZI|nr:hypothetical protein B0T15DRAFT_495447 [Chaetomium strumarium]